MEDNDEEEEDDGVTDVNILLQREKEKVKEVSASPRIWTDVEVHGNHIHFIREHTKVQSSYRRRKVCSGKARME